MARYSLTGNYGSFTVSRIIEAIDDDDAFMQTGIYTTLEAAGWQVVDHDDAEWDITKIDEEEA